VLIGLVVMALAAAGGCQSIMRELDLRFGPDEPQRQTAQVARDLAAVGSASGLPPASEASRRLAAAAAAGSAYAGPPAEPVDIAPLVPPGVRDAWSVRREQAERLKIRAGLYHRASRAVVARLGEIAADVQDRAQVAVAEILPRLRGLADAAAIVTEAAGDVPVPADPEVSLADRQRLEALDAAVAKLTDAAAAQAARRPTAGEVADRLADKAEKAADKTFELAERFGLSEALMAGLGTLGLGGAVSAWRSRRKRKKAEAEVEGVRHDAEVARIVELARNGVGPADAGGEVRRTDAAGDAED